MRDADLIALLRLIGESAARREDLITTLGADSTPGAATVAAALARGETVAQALAGIAPSHVRHLLVGPRPPLERAALLAADELEDRRLRRGTWRDHLAQPLLSSTIVLIAATIVVRTLHPTVAWPWLAAAVPGAIVISSALILPWCGEAIASRVTILGTWSYHLRRASLYARAALAVRWRMTEAEIATLLGADLARLAPALGKADAEEHCLRLADHHRDAAASHARMLGHILAAALLSMAGAVILAVAMGVLGQFSGHVMGP